MRWLPANILNLCYYRILQSLGSPDSFSPISRFHQNLVELQTHPLSKTLPAPLVLLEGPLSLGFQSCHWWSHKVTRCISGILWAWEECRVKEAGFEHVSSQMRTPPLCHLVTFHCPLPHWWLLIPNLTWAELGPGTKMPLDSHQQRVQWGLASFSPVSPKTRRGQGLVKVKVSVQSASSLVYLLRSVVFAEQGALVWVFECCCLLFFKGLLALPWGYCSRNSYLCFSPAYRLLTGTKWKTPAHSVLCVNMFYCPWFPALCSSVLFFMLYLIFLICSAFLGKPSGCNIVTFLIFFHKLPVCLCRI